MVCEDPFPSSTTATAAANNKTVCNIPPHFRPQSSAEELTAASSCASGKDRSWSWEEVRAVPHPTGTSGGGGGTIPGLVMAGGGRSDAEAKEGLLLPRESRTEDCGGDDDGKVGTDADTDADTDQQQSDTDNGNEGAPSQPAAPPASLSLSERRRHQRQSQLAFLRSKGLVPPSSSDATASGCAASSAKGGAGADSPAVREGFVVHRGADAAIANLRNNASFGSSDGGAAGGGGGGGGGAAGGSDKAEGDAILACPSVDAPSSTAGAPAASAATSAARTAPAAAAASYPNFPAYPETMVALSFRLGDRSSTRTGTGTGTGGGDTTSSNYDPMSSMINGARRAGVAVTGGALVAVGAVLTPLPTPGGILLAGAGLGVLSTEFEGARKVMDKGRDRLVDLIDSLPEEEEEEEEKNGDDEDNTCSDGSEKGEEGGRKAENLSASATVAQAAESNGATPTSEGAASSAPPTTTTTTNNNPKPDSSNIDAAKLKASFRSQVSRLGKSIRPLLADDDAPRRAIDELKIKSERKMGEVKASTNRAYGRMRSHLNEIVDQLALPDDESLGLHDWTTPELMEQEQEQQKKKKQGGMNSNGTGGTTTGAVAAGKEEMKDNKSTGDSSAVPAKSETSNGKIVDSSGNR